MQQTFTSNNNITHICKNENEIIRLDNVDYTENEPSDFTIQNILNFSKNLEVKKSEAIGFFDYLRS